MERVLDVAYYMYKEFTREMHHKIEEIKLHQLLYFAQRESFVQTEQPLFEEEFEGQKCGPVCIPVRKVFRQGQFENKESFEEIKQNSRDIVQKVLEQYGALRQKRTNGSTKPIPIINAAEVEEPTECVDVAAEIKKIQKDLKRRNRELCSVS